MSFLDMKEALNTRNRVHMIYRGEEDKTSYQVSAGFYQGQHPFKGQFNDFRFLVLLKGSGTLYTARKTYTLTPGSIVRRAPDKPHEIRRHASQEWLEYFLILPKSLDVLLNQLSVSPSQSLVFQFPEPHFLFHFLSTHHEEFYQTQYYSPPAFLSWFFTLVHQLFYSQLARVVTQPGAIEDRSLKPKARHFILEAQGLLQKQIYEKINLQEISSALGLSFDAFRKRFTSELGVSPKAYAINLKMTKAQEILFSENIKVQELAAKLAYADAFTFSKQFKAHTGSSPREFRERMRA